MADSHMERHSRVRGNDQQAQTVYGSATEGIIRPEREENMPPPERYNTGYNVGVGGAVVHNGRLLLVRRASRRGRGNWQVPGGFIELDETIEQAVIREIEEEAGVTAEVEGILVELGRSIRTVGDM